VRCASVADTGHEGTELGVAGDQGQGPVVQSALLRNELIRLRKDRAMTQEQVAGALEWSPSKLIRVEGGRSSITRVDLEALLTLYELGSPEERERLVSLNRSARDRGWWDAYKNYALGETYLNYVGYEAGASVIRQSLNTVIPGLLQTREYAVVVTENSADAESVRPVVDLRMQRQEELANRSAPPRQYYILDEAVIRRHVGINKDPAIMPNQLRRMADRAERDELVTVRVIPFTAGALGQYGPFTLLEFDGDLPDLLYLDATRIAIHLIADPDVVGEYAEAFAALLEDAFSAEHSLDFIRTVADEM
jgi:transcriptional regulator with XRE-family HTH domain